MEGKPDDTFVMLASKTFCCLRSEEQKFPFNEKGVQLQSCLRTTNNLKAGEELYFAKICEKCCPRSHSFVNDEFTLE
jgi:hypothetical protein